MVLSTFVHLCEKPGFYLAVESRVQFERWVRNRLDLSSRERRSGPLRSRRFSPELVPELGLVPQEPEPGREPMLEA